MMALILGTLCVLTFAIANRARGSKFFDTLKSTVESRVLAAFLSAASTIPLTLYLSPWQATGVAMWIWGSLIFWCTPKWDKYWSNAIGHSLTHSRLYGMMQMTIRMQLILPCLIGAAVFSGHADRAWYAIGSLTLGMPYYLAGYQFPLMPIKVSEYAVGAIIGLMITLILI